LIWNLSRGVKIAWGVAARERGWVGKKKEEKAKFGQGPVGWDEDHNRSNPE